ncbi:hypothetical protein ACFX2F_004275 [Malus domestica]
MTFNPWRNNKVVAVVVAALSIEYFDQDGIETFSMVDDLYGDVLIMMEEEDDHVDMSGPVDDLPVSKTKMLPRVEEVSHGVDQGTR